MRTGRGSWGNKGGGGVINLGKREKCIWHNKGFAWLHATLVTGTVSLLSIMVEL